MRRIHMLYLKLRMFRDYHRMGVPYGVAWKKINSILQEADKILPQR